MRQIPDKPLARPGRLPSDIDGDTPGPLRQLSEEDEAAVKRAEELKPVKQKIFEFSVYVRDLELPDVRDTEKKLITNILDIAGRAIHDVGKGLK